MDFNYFIQSGQSVPVTVIKIEKGELTLDDLSKADQKVISRMLEERK